MSGRPNEKLERSPFQLSTTRAESAPRLASGESLLLYRAYTFVDPGDLALGDARSTERVGVFKYGQGRFEPHRPGGAPVSAPSPYGELTQVRELRDPGLAIKDPFLQQVEQASLQLVETFTTPDAARY